MVSLLEIGLVVTLCGTLIKPGIAAFLDVRRARGLNTLPQRLRQYLLDQPETTDDLHVVSVILKDGRVFEDVAISHCSLVAAVRGHSHVPFDAQGYSGIARHPSALGFWTGDQALLAFRTLS